MKYQLHPDYPYLQPFIEQLESHFQQATQVLHAERNEIRIVRFADQDYVVKSFKIPNMVNRFAYGYLRDSKAKRSYRYSLTLGTDICPQPVAYIEHFQYGLLSRSYYISHHFNYDFTIRSLLNDADFADRSVILQKFAEFTYQLHQKGILHRDYSPGNILIKQQDDKTVFKIIDVNRMQFKTLSLKDRLTNFARLMVDDATMKVILNRYAQLIKTAETPLLLTAIGIRAQFTRRRKLKNKLRGRG
jgi:serine/threonine protein kinase